MKVWIFGLTLLILALSACNNGAKARFVINNQTGDIMDSIKILPNRDVAHLYTNIMPDNVGKYVADMGDVQSDGSYTLSYRKWSTHQHFSHTFGYFSNGKPLEDQLFVEVWRDTIIVKSDLKAF